MANKAEKTAVQPLTSLQDKSDGDNNIIIPKILLPIGESQGGTTITLALRTPEHLYRAYNLVPSLISEGPDSPESQAQPPASTAPARIEGEGARKKRRVQNKLYRDSQYEL